MVAMKKYISLCRNSEFQRLYRKGRSAVRGTMVVYAGKGRRGMLRLGITAGKKLGGAVCRNRAKRRIRELFRSSANGLKSGMDICIVARSRILTAKYNMVEKDFMSAMAELKLFAEDKSDEKTVDFND